MRQIAPAAEIALAAERLDLLLKRVVDGKRIRHAIAAVEAVDGSFRMIGNSFFFCAGEINVQPQTSPPAIVKNDKSRACACHIDLGIAHGGSKRCREAQKRRKS